MKGIIVDKEGCKKSADGKHCFHQTINSSIVYIPGGATTLSEICCFCGKTKEMKIELPASYSYMVDTSKHGPHCPTTIMY